MHDDVIFEARLADALGRYAELAPSMDDDVVARDAIAAGRSSRGLRRLLSLRPEVADRAGSGRPAPRIGYLLIVLALLLAAILVALAAGVFRNETFRPLGRNGAIAFTYGGNNHEPVGTHLVNPDGTGDRAIEVGRCPTYSTDGSVLAALSYEKSAYLVVQGADGAPPRKILLVETPSTSVSYALSPDGTRVAWFKPVASGAIGSVAPDGGTPTSAEGVELWVAPIAGGPGTRIAPGSVLPNESYASPVWSPDGGHIAFGSFVADAATGERRRSVVNVVATDGSGLRRLTARPALLDDGMSWSPDGRFIAYLGLPDGPPIPTPATDGAPTATAFPPRDVFVIGADGSGDRNLTNTPAFESQPEWSPDGAVLAFETSADGEAHRLTTVHMNGPTPVNLPVLGPESPWFVWSPDGSELLWLEVTSLGAEANRSTLHSIDRDFRQTPTTLQAVDGLIVCTPSWQRLEP
jgi:hypothetical protein